MKYIISSWGKHLSLASGHINLQSSQSNISKIGFEVLRHEGLQNGLVVINTSCTLMRTILLVLRMQLHHVPVAFYLSLVPILAASHLNITHKQT